MQSVRDVTWTRLVKSLGFAVVGLAATYAYGVRAAALLPWRALFPSINKGESIKKLAERYELNEEVVRYRVQITGADTLYKSRRCTRR